MRKTIIALAVLVVMLVFAACGKGTLPDSPPSTPPLVVPAGPSSLATSQNITREQAIEIASRGLPPSIVDRAEIRAALHGWYWEVVFDNLNATADELTPYVFRSGLPGQAGQPATEPFPGIWQTVIISVDARTGEPGSTGARQASKPGPYVSQEQAIQSARERVLGLPTDVSWIGRAKVDSYLQGDTWIVLFWEENSAENRIKTSVDAVTGVTVEASRG